MSIIKRLKEEHLDVLGEIGNIGVGNSATALSMLLDKSINIRVPSVEIVEFQNICDFIGGEEEIVYAVFFRVEGEIEGNLFFLIKEESALKLIKNVGTEDDSMMEDEDISTLGEIGNILAASYITSLSDLTNNMLSITVPQINKDMAGAILTFGLLQYSEIGNEAIFINTSLFQGNEKIEGYMLFLPDPGAFEKVFASLGMDV